MQGFAKYQDSANEHVLEAKEGVDEHVVSFDHLYGARALILSAYVEYGRAPSCACAKATYLVIIKPESIAVDIKLRQLHSIAK
jgi:hypothetical protein